mmetsp:Transcript_30581/g.98564  ORF Transcript_30581/g.98564 Transcript_30581/m.98564 type:complete len:161 (-) Transcript_30581:109-591(-)
MNLLSLGEARFVLRQTRRAALGLDVGGSKVGLVLSRAPYDAKKPLATLRHRPSMVGAIRDVVREHDVGVLAVGWPLELSGRAGPRCAEVLEFLRELRRHDVHAAAALCDERLSTQAARDALRQAGVRRRWRRACDRHEDRIAADAILDVLLGHDFVDHPP